MIHKKIIRASIISLIRQVSHLIIRILAEMKIQLRLVWMKESLWTRTLKGNFNLFLYVFMLLSKKISETVDIVKK